MVDSLISYASMFVVLFLVHLVVLSPLLVWWLCRFRIWIGLKVLIGILIGVLIWVYAIPIAMFLFGMLYISVAILVDPFVGLVLLPVVWIVFGLIVWGAVSVLSRYPSRPDEG